MVMMPKVPNRCCPDCHKATLLDAGTVISIATYICSSCGEQFSEWISTEAREKYETVFKKQLAHHTRCGSAD